MLESIIKTGVYTITNIITHKIYVGSTKDSFKRRWALHLFHLKNNRHDNRYLQNSWNKYGESAFKFEILEECDSEFCISLEQYWMNMLNSCNRNFGYNILCKAGSSVGIKRTDSQKEYSSFWMLKNMPSHHKEAISKAQSISVLQYDLNMNFIKEWVSIIKASQGDESLRKHISDVCKNKRKSAGGFKWKYGNN